MQLSSDNLSFSQALKNIKTPSQESLLSSRSTNQGILSRYKSEPRLDSFLSPRARLINRTNTTLRHIVEEFRHLPNNQYVLRLGFNQKKSGDARNFDQWICSVSARQKYNNPLSEYNPSMKGQAKRKEIREHIQMQANQIRLKSQINNKKIDQQKFCSNTNSHLESGTTVSKKHKFSFSGFFQENEGGVPAEKREVITQISIMNQNYGDDEVIQDQILRQAQLEKECAQDLREGNQKQNENPNCMREIKGLQFSKNRRYKTTKKKRKAKD